MFQIGAFARLAGVSAKQLRAYDEIGLFRPVWVDPSSAYRHYSTRRFCLRLSRNFWSWVLH